jgi:ribonuclease HI
MTLITFFDASFNTQNKTANIAVIIKDYNKEILLLKSVKNIKCANSYDGEFRALNKAVHYLNDRQNKNLLPKNIEITIFGDCKLLIESVKNLKRIRGIDSNNVNNFLRAYNQLILNNKVNLIWISRHKNHEAHLAAKSYMRSIALEESALY